MSEINAIATNNYLLSTQQEVSHDNSLSGNGTVDSPLGVVPGYNETVLWSGSPGIYLNNDTAALSEAFTNFDRVAIYAVSVYGGPARRFEFDVSADNSQFRFMTNSLDGAAILNVAFNLNLSGTTATLSRSKLIMVQYSTNAITTSDLSAGSTYKSYITSIVGINRKA